MKMWLRINMRKIVILMLALIIAVGTFFMYPRANFNSTDNLETKLNNATLNSSWDPSGMGITPEDIVKKAVELGNNTSTPFSSGCIGLVNNVIKGVQSNSSLQDGCKGWKEASTINGISASKAEYAYTDNSMTGETWYDTLGMDADSLQVGDIIIGEGHAMIYLGQASSYSELNSNLYNTYGVKFNDSWVNGFTSGDSSGSYYKDYLNTEGRTGVSCTYWTIDVNGNGGYARVSCYNWKSSDESEGSKNLDKMHVYRFAKPTGEYNLKIVKKSTTSTTAINDYSNGLAGAKFSVDQYLNSDGNTTTTATNSKTVETTAGLTTIYSPVSITSTSADRYQLKETAAPNGYTTINNWTIGLQVHKTLEGSTYKVDHVTFLGNGLAANGQTVTPGHYMKINSAGEASIDSNTTDYIIAISLGSAENCDIVVTWKNPRDVTGSYHMYIGKRDIEDLETPVAGATFEIKRYKNNVTANEKKVDVTTVTSGNTYAASNGCTAIQIGDEARPLNEQELANWNTTIDDITNYDKYTIYEKSAPAGYSKMSDTMVLRVYKKEKDDGSKYVIDKIEVCNYNETSVIGSATYSSENGNLYIKKTGTSYAIGTNSDWFMRVEVSSGAVAVYWANQLLEGTFNLNLVKYIKNTETPLAGAGFKIKIENKATKEAVVDGNNMAIDGTKEYEVGPNGRLNISGINIEEAGITYVVTIQESTVPEGYTGISEAITFEAVSALSSDGKTFVLTSAVPTIENTKKVEITKNQIWIELENAPKIEIHKGVKDVQNQDSGYNGDEVQDWVIQSNVPFGIGGFTKYIITDVIDERLEFLGTETVTAKIVDGEDLTKDTNYQVTYDEETRTLKISFIEDTFTAGQALPENSIIEIRFNTKFAVDENGNIIALNQSVPNTAELTYNNGSTEETKKSETPEVHTGVVGIFKYDKETGNALVGAEFKIATSKENAENEVFVKDAAGNDLVATSGENGVAMFTGLEFGEDAMDDAKYKTIDETTGAEVYKYDWEKVETKYYIIETKSPDGYKKLEEPIEVTVNKDSGDIVDIEDLVGVSNEKLIFDLALRKWVTQAIVTENGQTVITETGHKAEDDPEDVVKVDLKKSKINKVTVKFRYSIRITNEGEIAGEAQEISDYIPAGLKFVQEDNPDWVEVDGKVTTDKLKGVTLEPGESAEVEIVLTWVNSESNMGVMVNTAEISKDYNEYGTPDIDSTPNNKVSGEDDIDDAPVMLTVTTGQTVIMIMSIALGVVTIIGTGVTLIKKYI